MDNANRERPAASQDFSSRPVEDHWLATVKQRPILQAIESLNWLPGHFARDNRTYGVTTIRVTV